MLKISHDSIEAGKLKLRLEGSIAGPWVAELQSICAGLPASQESSVVLDLAEVSFADEHGLKLLHALRAGGAKLLRLSPFVAEQLRSAAG